MTRVLSAAFMLMFIACLSCATWVGATVENQQPFQDGVSEGTTQIASDTNISVVPPEPELGEPAAEEPVAEIQRLRRLIGEKRKKIETSRSEALRQVQETYQANLAAIQPKDMFETEAEYWARDARQKSEVEIEKAKATNDLHRRHDALLSKEVEPLFERVRTLLGRTGILQKEAIRFNLEKYDPELGVFHGTFELDSDLLKITARVFLPMKREKARVWWKNRSALQGKVRMSVNVNSLGIELEEFYLEDSGSGNRTEERVAVVEVRRPSQKERKTAKEFKASASELAKRASQGARDRDPLGKERTKATGWIAEYNRLVGEAQSAFTKDQHIQALKTLSYGGSNPQASGAVTTAAKGLEAYLTSFVSQVAFKVSAAELAKRASQGARDRDPLGKERTKATGWIAEYNRLVGEAQSAFTKDQHIQALKTLSYGGSNPQASGAVTTAAKGLEAYLTSFVSQVAFKVSAAELAKRASQGARDRDPLGKERTKATGWIAEYNRLVGEAQSAFTKDQHIQALKTLSYGGSNPQASGAVTTAAKGLEAYLTSFVSQVAFKVSAAELAKRASQGARDRDPLGKERTKVTGWIAEYNRLVGEAQSAFTKDQHIQALKTLSYGGSSSQAAHAANTAAERLVRIMRTIKDPPRLPSVEAVAKVTALGYPSLDYLPYSGRFSQDVHKLAKLLGRGFSPDARDENGWTDLHYAAALNLSGLASALLDADAAAATLKSDSEVFSDRLSVRLAGFGRDTTNLKRQGQMPLHYAARWNALGVATNLVVHGAELNARTVHRWTPLHYATRWDSRSVAKLLIGRGADINAKSRKGWTPLDIAMRVKASNMATILRRHGGQCNREC